MKLFKISLIIIYVLAFCLAIYNLIVFYQTGKIDSYYVYIYGTIFALSAIASALRDINKLSETANK